MVSRYLLEKKADDSSLLMLIIRIMDALGNYGKVYVCLSFVFIVLATFLCFCLCPDFDSYPFIKQLLIFISYR